MQGDDDPGFAAWCERWCLGRLRRRLAEGLPLSTIGWRTLRRFGFPRQAAEHGAIRVVLIEHPDVTGARWAAALGLLLEAGRGAMP
jgi:hypothetical protein